MEIARKIQTAIIIGSLAITAMLTFAVPVNAQSTIQESEKILQQIEEKGIVPCGTRTTKPCETCDIFKLGKNVTDFIMAAGLIIAGAAVGIGGFLILAGSYSEEQVKKGKEFITAAVIGLIIILFAWLIVDTTIKVLVGDVTIFDQTGTGGAGFSNVGPWNDFQCEEFKL